jgi:hypothetical protein
MLICDRGPSTPLLFPSFRLCVLVRSTSITSVIRASQFDLDLVCGLDLHAVGSCRHVCLLPSPSFFIYALVASGAMCVCSRRWRPSSRSWLMPTTVPS